MVATKNNTHGECPKGDKKVRRRLVVNAHGECPNGDKKVRRRGRAPGKKRRSLNKLCNRLTKQHQNGDKKVRRRGHASGGKRRSLKQFCNSQTKLRQNNSCAANCHQENRRGLNFHTFHDIRDDKNLLREEDKSKKSIQEVVLPPLEINEDKMERNNFYKEKQSKLPGISQMRNVQGRACKVDETSNNRPRAPVDVEDEEPSLWDLFIKALPPILLAVILVAAAVFVWQGAPFLIDQMIFIVGYAILAIVLAIEATVKAIKKFIGVCRPVNCIKEKVIKPTVKFIKEKIVEPVKKTVNTLKEVAKEVGNTIASGFKKACSWLKSKFW